MHKAYLLSTNIVGRQYHDADSVWHKLTIGTELRLVAEPDNKYDHYAVSVWLEDAMLGYVPRVANEWLAVMLNMGWGEAFFCVISKLDCAATYDNQIGITISVLHAPEKEVKANQAANETDASNDSDESGITDERL